MKRNIISNILLVVLAIVLTGCEKLPDLYGNYDYQSYYYDDFSGIIIFTLPTSVRFNANYISIMQMSENSDFSGATTIDFTGDSSYKTITNLKPGTTYYYRPVITDDLGGVKYGATYSFKTKEQDFKYVSIESSWGNCYSYGDYEGSDGSGYYELTFTITFNSEITTYYEYGLKYNFHVQTPESDYDCGYRPLSESVENWGTSFQGKPSDTVTYWITISDENDTLLYTSEKETITCPAFN